MTAVRGASVVIRIRRFGGTPRKATAMTQNPILAALSAAGVSVWLDDLSRDRLRSGSLQQLIDTRQRRRGDHEPDHLPARALPRTGLRRRHHRAHRTRGATPTPRSAPSSPTMSARPATSFGLSGKPQTASTGGSRSRWTRTWRTTPTRQSPKRSSYGGSSIVPICSSRSRRHRQGFPAITATVGEGISVNVTLIFSVQRHREVMSAYLAGLEAARHAGRDLSQIHSVASFFVSRVDTEVDARLERIGCAAAPLRGQAGIANAQLAYAAYQEVFDSGTRYAALSYDGARVQRPLWASTGVKNPDYPDTKYITGLVAPHTVNTIPEPTLQAVAEHGVITGDTITGTAPRAQAVFDQLTAVGVDLPQVFVNLENEGVAKFEASWDQLLDAYPTADRAAKMPVR